jgi:hypothetical protein
MTTTTARILPSVDDLDPFATTATIVGAAALRECMVLMDPELGTPAVWLDHRLAASPRSGEVAWLAHNLDTGRLETVRIRRTAPVAVLA